MSAEQELRRVIDEMDKLRALLKRCLPYVENDAGKCELMELYKEARAARRLLMDIEQETK